MSGDVELKIRELIRQTCQMFEIDVLKGEVSKGHVHFLVSAPPNMAPSEIMRGLKGVLLANCLSVSLNSKEGIGDVIFGRGGISVLLRMS